MCVSNAASWHGSHTASQVFSGLFGSGDGAALGVLAALVCESLGLIAESRDDEDNDIGLVSSGRYNPVLPMVGGRQLSECGGISIQRRSDS